MTVLDVFAILVLIVLVIAVVVIWVFLAGRVLEARRWQG